MYILWYLVLTWMLLDASGLLWIPPNDSGKEVKVEIQEFFVWSIKNKQMNRVKPMYARERGPLAHELVVCYKGVSMGGWIPCQPLWGKYLFSATLQPKPASASFLKKKTRLEFFQEGFYLNQKNVKVTARIKTKSESCSILCKLFRLQTRGWGSSCLVWMPPHTGSLINTLFNDASWLTRHPRVKQSTTTCCAGVLDISWFLVLLLPDWYVYLIGGGPHTELWGRPHMN